MSNIFDSGGEIRKAISEGNLRKVVSSNMFLYSNPALQVELVLETLDNGSQKTELEEDMLEKLRNLRTEMSEDGWEKVEDWRKELNILRDKINKR